MRMSDAIAAYILHMMETQAAETIELRRNELAGEIGCVPSQINYVLSSRFTPEHGYIVESRRGGGGYIRIRRVPFQSEVSMITHVVNAIGESLMLSSAEAILHNLRDRNVIDSATAQVMYAAVNDRAYADVAVASRDRLRAKVMKSMLTAAIIAKK